jgi:hypothetical protein
VPVTRSNALIGVLSAGMLLITGCADFDNPAAAHGVTRNDLVAELAAQLAASSSHTYAATYQLPGGETGTIVQAQDPVRSAYTYPSGKLLLRADNTTVCVKAVCTLTATAAAAPPAAIFAAAEHDGLVPPNAVLTLLNAAALDADVTVKQSDTTIAGRHATCVTLGQVDEATPDGTFSTCITSDGVLGSFTGTLTDRKIDVDMTNYTDKIPAGAFATPPDAKLIDQR